MPFPTLEKILAYHNPDILERFSKKTGVTPSESQEIFRETLKMLWIMALRRKEGHSKFLVFNQMAVLDESWHNFVLFTKEYSDFCNEHFGHYLHHAPTTSKEREIPILEADVEHQCRYIVEKLGEDTLVRWFKDYPTRFRSVLT